MENTRLIRKNEAEESKKTLHRLIRNQLQQWKPSRKTATHEDCWVSIFSVPERKNASRR